MFNLKEKFEFLEDGIDFPFYNDKPKLSSAEWAFLAVGVVIFAILANMVGITKSLRVLIYLIVLLAPALYICKGDYSLFFKKLKRGDGKTIVICLILSIVYSTVLGIFLAAIHYPTAPNANLTSTLDLMFIVNLFLQLICEEFYKIFILLIVMYLVYKYTRNRSLSIYVGIIVTLVVFGLTHVTAYNGRILQILLIQGFGSIFDLYAYMKTKNFFVSYIVHICVDLYGLILPLMTHM